MSHIPFADPVRARDFSAVAHGSQTYNDEVPYVRHTEFVVAVLQRFGFNEPELVCAGHLHDAIEDTKTSYNDINDRFGVKVAELVYSVTSEQGRNRKERNAKTYPKIARRFYPTALKLADRIANVEYGNATGGKVDMYRKEYPGFRGALWTDTQWVNKFDCDIAPGSSDMRVARMWAHLDMLLGSTLGG